jgi:hypothetical protein
VLWKVSNFPLNKSILLCLMRTYFPNLINLFYSSLYVVKRDGSIKQNFMFNCSFQYQRTDETFLKRQTCCFFLKYKMNPYTRYFTLSEYDEMHNHPIRKEIFSRSRSYLSRDFYISQKSLL